VIQSSNGDFSIYNSFAFYCHDVSNGLHHNPQPEEWQTLQDGFISSFNQSRISSPLLKGTNLWLNTIHRIKGAYRSIMEKLNLFIAGLSAGVWLMNFIDDFLDQKGLRSLIPLTMFLLSCLLGFVLAG
jgi:hypothetical protein